MGKSRCHQVGLSRICRQRCSRRWSWRACRWDRYTHLRPPKHGEAAAVGSEEVSPFANVQACIQLPACGRAGAAIRGRGESKAVHLGHPVPPPSISKKFSHLVEYRVAVRFRNWTKIIIFFSSPGLGLPLSFRLLFFHLVCPYPNEGGGQSWWPQLLGGRRDEVRSLK